MEGVVVQFRRGRRTYKPRHFLISVDGIKNRQEASKLIGKKVTWKSPGERTINGVIKAPHGNKGIVRAIFEKGLPGQAITTKADIED